MGKKAMKGERVLYSKCAMKKLLIVLMLLALIVMPVMAQGSKEPVKSDAPSVFPAGEVLFWSTGQPQHRLGYYKNWLERNREMAPDVNIAVETIATNGHHKIIMYALAGDKTSLPEAIFLDTVGILELASADLLVDMTDSYNSVKNEFLEGAALDATINGRVYGLPESIRPQMLFYNATIFEEYGIDPAMMDTFDGYLEAGRLLKQKSNGKVYLSYVDPSTFTWRYWGRRGLMPQANARIWDDEGNVVIGSDTGTKLALNFFDALYSENLLFKTSMMQQPLYEATDEGKIATFYIGAFWGEFLRGNLKDTAGDWRVMPAPMFKEIGTRGAPVSTSFCVVNKGTNEYKDFLFRMWYDFQTNLVERNAWVSEMERIGGPYNNPVAKELLADPFWQEPSEFYGGQSFRKAEGEALVNPSMNMPVTASDAEADGIISKELEKYIAGEQSIAQAIANMDKELKIRIKKAKIPK